MKNNISLKFFEIENDKKLLDFETYDGVPIWMISRWYLLYNVVGEKLLEFESIKRKRKANLDMVKFTMKAGLHNVKKRQSARDIILYSTNRKTFVDNRYFNRYVDQMYNIYEKDTLVIEQATIEWDWPFPRTSHNVCFDTVGRVFGEAASRVFYKRDLNEVRKMVKYFFDRVQNITGICIENSELAQIEIHLAKFIAAQRFQAKWLEKQLSHDTKIVITVGAGFPYYYFINKMLKERNVISAELQHGYITRSNIMYNYADAIVNDSRVKYGLPNFILTYGNWWNEQMNCPIEKIAIGNPYRMLSINEIKHVSTNNKNIVICGIGEDTEKYIELTYELSKRLSDYNIVFRPHPGEKDIAKRILANKGYSIMFDVNIDIYETLSNFGIVIGEVSTVLFEALGIVNSVILWDTEYSRTYLPDHPFKTFKNVEQLEKIIHTESNNDSIDGKMFWSENWEKNYKCFINKILYEKATI